MPYLYFKNVNTYGSWSSPLNWFTDDACTSAAANVPWIDGDSLYLAYDLTRGFDSVAAEDNVLIDSDIVDNVTGECDIGFVATGGSLENVSGVFGGTFTGFGFINSGAIFGGTFAGESFSNGGDILGGTFTGVTIINLASIYGGTFSAEAIYNSSSVFGGTFTGENFSNTGSIYGGTFTGSSYSNAGNINGGTFTGENFSNTGSIYGGTFTGAGFSNSGNIAGGQWLESGTLEVDSYDYNGGTTVVTTTRVAGSLENPSVYDPSSVSGFATLKVPGQDVLGTGLL